MGLREGRKGAGLRIRPLDAAERRLAILTLLELGLDPPRVLFHRPPDEPAPPRVGAPRPAPGRPLGSRAAPPKPISARGGCSRRGRIWPSRPRRARAARNRSNGWPSTTSGGG